MHFLLVPMHGASLASAFNFCDAFWQISLICLLNFHLQSKVMPSSLSLREFMCKSPVLVVFQPASTCQWRRSGIFIVNFEHISHLVLVFLLLTLNILLVFNFISLFEKQFTRFSPISSRAFITSVKLSLTTCYVLPSP